MLQVCELRALSCFFQEDFASYYEAMSISRDTQDAGPSATKAALEIPLDTWNVAGH